MSSLYILGNGFDIAHGLKTSYEDFHQWLLNDSRHRCFVDGFEKLYPNVCKDGTKEWNNIESALGAFSMSDVKQFDENYNYCSKEQEETSKSTYIVGSNVKSVIVVLAHLLMAWAKSIKYSVAKPKEPFNSLFNATDYFVTFNYTMTLEKVYSISPDKVFHIHGSIFNPNEELIIGYCPNSDENMSFQASLNPSNEEKLHILMTNMIKPIKFCIDRLHNSSDGALQNIDKVIIYGHSCSEVDKPYFVEISKMISDTAKWVYYYHNPTAKTHFERFAHDVIEQSGQNHQQIEIISDSEF